MSETETYIAQYGDMVYRLAYARTHSRNDADDIFQEVFFRCFRRKPIFESLEHAKAWFIRVTLNCAKSHWIRFRGFAPLDDRIPFTDPEESSLDAALEKLSAKNRTVIHLYYYEGYSTDEIAELLREKPSTIRTRLTRAREKLRELMKGDLDNGFSRTVSPHE